MVVAPPEQEGLVPNSKLPGDSSLHPASPGPDDDYINPFLTRDKVRRTFVGTAIKALEEGRKPIPRDPFGYDTPSSLGSGISLVANPPSPGSKTVTPYEETNSESNIHLQPPANRISQSSEASEHFSVVMLQRGRSLKSTQVQITSNPPRRVLSALPPKIQVPPKSTQRSITPPNPQKVPTLTTKLPGHASPPEANQSIPSDLRFEMLEREDIPPPLPSIDYGHATRQKHHYSPPETPDTLINITPPPETYYPPGDRHDYPQKSKVQPFTEKLIFFNPKGSKHSSQDPLAPNGAQKPDPDFSSCACIIL